VYFHERFHFAEPKQADTAVAMSQTDELAGEKISALEKQSDDLSSAIAVSIAQRKSEMCF
jgi:hypothetical protein